MLGRLFLLFVIVPLIEIVLLIQIGSAVGLVPTIALVLITGAIGAALARSQGAQVLRGIRAEMAAGRVPASSLIDGLFVLIGGVLLLTPGILTDLFGLGLLLPFTRSRLKRSLQGRIQEMVRTGEVSVFTLTR